MNQRAEEERRCRAIEPLRCWQYRKGDSSAVPRWIASHLRNLSTNKPRFHDGSGGEWQLDDGDWIVELVEEDEGSDGDYAIYADKNFVEQYTLEPAS